jgi:acetyl esterase/lipase
VFLDAAGRTPDQCGPDLVSGPQARRRRPAQRGVRRGRPRGRPTRHPVARQAEYDRLRDEAATYARKLDAVGSLVEYHEVKGVDHGYNIMSNETDVTRRMYAFIADHVVRATSRNDTQEAT